MGMTRGEFLTAVQTYVAPGVDLSTWLAMSQAKPIFQPEALDILAVLVLQQHVVIDVTYITITDPKTKKKTTEPVLVVHTDDRTAGPAGPVWIYEPGAWGYDSLQTSEKVELKTKTVSGETSLVCVVEGAELTYLFGKAWHRTISDMGTAVFGAEAPNRTAWPAT